jgi:stage V sporulation protein AE
MQWCIVITEAKEHCFIGVLSGIFQITSAGISSAIIFGFWQRLFLNQKDESDAKA